MRIKNENKIAEVSAYLTIFVFTTIVLVLGLIFRKVWQLTKNLNKKSVEEFNNKYAKLTEGLKETKTRALIFLWKPLNLVRWFLTLGILLILKT